MYMQIGLLKFIVKLKVCTKPIKHIHSTLATTKKDDLKCIFLFRISVLV